MKDDKKVLTDALLKQGLELYYENALKDAHENEALYFDAAHEKKMQRLFAQQKKPYYKLINSAGKRAAMIAVTFLALLSGVVFGVDGVRVPVFRFAIESYEKFSLIVFSPPGKKDVPETIEQLFLPTYIADGFAIENEELLSDSNLVTYTKGDMAYVFEQYTLTDTTRMLDTEDAETGTVALDAGNAFYFTKYSTCSLIWENGDYGFFLSGVISKEEAIKIANSVKAE